jgi:general nucleoside transport system permease protein
VSTPDDELPPDATVAARLSTYLRGGGVITPLITVLVAFIVGGLVVFATGHDPFSTYRAIFDGTGLNWLFPWTSAEDRTIAALNLQQTLLRTAPLILAGLAVAFAFRCGLFNIGGQGQYILGVIFAVWVGSSFDGLPAFVHIVVSILAGILAGAVWAGIAGLMKALAGTNEVISTIMLNWIAIWGGVWVFNLGSPLQNDNPAQVDVPVSNDIVEAAKLPVFWGDPQLQGLHVGIFIALAALVVFWVLLNRTTLGYEVRAVGFNPDAAEASGINVRRNYVLVMAICGGFAGLGGAMDLLGWQFRVATNDIQTTQLAFFGIAVALLGRNTAVGVLLGALLFAGLLTGTSVRNLDPTVFEPQLATNLTYMIQGLVVLLISTDVLVVYLLRRRRRRRK